ncbi:C-C motif chemokine 13-like [Pangasianodon hypophthalmus]|uniref:C-C motif chemokine 13-like n=1 Tax=Pangasianodon hypophthalmus TaxID=310915 RepID=UPI00230800F6|nr:C-C motif chemokine 13-like [Pangasianodon hypophthalmus]
MRNLAALLFLLSLCSLHLVSSAPPSFDYKNRCCSEITKAKVPLKNIVTYWKTSSHCNIKAIVFETLNKEKKINHFCVDPTEPWVDSHMKAVDRKNNTPLTANP